MSEKLSKTEFLLQERGADYGDFAECAVRWADLKSCLESALSMPLDFYKDKCFSLVIDMWALKLARLAHKEKQDTIDDLGGYSALLIKVLNENEAQWVLDRLQRLAQREAELKMQPLYKKLYECYQKEFERICNEAS